MSDDVTVDDSPSVDRGRFPALFRAVFLTFS